MPAKKPMTKRGAKKKKGKFFKPHTHQQLLDGEVTHPGERLFIIRRENRRIKNSIAQPKQKRIKRTTILDLYLKGREIEELAIIFSISVNNVIELLGEYYKRMDKIAAE